MLCLSVSVAFDFELRGRSLDTGRGWGIHKGRRGANQVLPLQIKVAENVLAMLKAGESTKEFFSSFIVERLKF